MNNFVFEEEKFERPNLQKKEGGSISTLMIKAGIATDQKSAEIIMIIATFLFFLLSIVIIGKYIFVDSKVPPKGLEGNAYNFANTK